MEINSQFVSPSRLQTRKAVPPQGHSLEPKESLGSGVSGEAPGLMKPQRFDSAPPAVQPGSIPSAQVTVGNSPAGHEIREQLLEALTSKGVPIPKDTTIVVMGAQSDNVVNRTPGRSLARLAETGQLDPAQGHRVILADRVSCSNQEWLTKFEKGDPGQSRPVTPEAVQKFAHLAHLDGAAPGDGIQAVDASNAADFGKLKGLLANAKNVIFFVSLPPFLAAPVLSNISQMGIGREPGQKLTIIQEKPFGQDAKSAHELAALIDSKFKPGEVLNIDHFNGYPGTLNALLHRLDPAMDGALNKDYVDDIHVILQESVKSNDRKAFIGMGIVKDMQGHALQTAATILSDYPMNQHLSGQDVSQAKDDFIARLEVSPEGVRRGQFEGFSDPATGYPADLKEPSNAETLETSKFKINSDRWQGVPGHFTLLKGSDNTKFGVDLHMKKLTPALASQLGLPEDTKGTLTFQIHPGDSVHFTTDAGQKVQLPFYEEAGSDLPYVPFFVSAANGNTADFVSTAAAVKTWDSIETTRNNWGPDDKMIHYPIGASLEEVNRRAAES